MQNEILNYLETLEASLKKKERLLVSLIDLTKKQEVILKQEAFDVEGFDEIMEEKAKLIEEINFLDEGFESIFAIVREAVVANPKMYEHILKPMQNSIRALVDKGVELETLERRNQLKVEYVIGRDKTKIKQFNVSSGAAAKYYSSMMKAEEGSNIFLDKKK